MLQRPLLTPNRTDAEKFLKTLDPHAKSSFTFQTFDDDAKRKDKTREANQHKRCSCRSPE